MTNLTPSDIYDINRKAGFDPISAIMATAIALAESKGNASAIGDVNNPTPGSKSVGLFQINYSPGRDSAVIYRDPVSNLDPLQNARHAFIISNGGKNFDPWTTYKNGSFMSYYSAAEKAAIKTDPGLDLGVTSGVIGVPSAPRGGLHIPGTPFTIGNPLNALRTGTEKVVFTALFLAAGVGLVVLGIARGTGLDKTAVRAVKASATDGASELGEGQE